MPRHPASRLAPAGSSAARSPRKTIAFTRLAALLWGGALLLAASPSHAELTPDNVWIVAQTTGNAYVARGDEKNLVWAPLSDGQLLEEKDVVGTGPDGSLVLTHGQDVLRVTANSIVSLAETNGPGGQTRVVERFGRVLVEVEKRPGWEFQVETPYLTALVKGTGFSVSVDGEGADVVVDHGLVGVTSHDGTTHADLGPGDSGHVASAAGAGLSVSGPSGTGLVGRSAPSATGSSAPGAAPAGPSSGAAGAAAAGASGQSGGASASGGEHGSSGGDHGSGGGEHGSGSGDHGSGEHGSSGSASGQGGSASGQGGSASGQGGSAPGHSGSAPGHSGDAPGQGGSAPGNSGSAPGHSGDSPGNSGNAPGHSGDSPGNSGNAPGHSGDAHGNSGNAPGHNK